MSSSELADDGLNELRKTLDKAIIQLNALLKPEPPKECNCIGVDDLVFRHATNCPARPLRNGEAPSIEERAKQGFYDIPTTTPLNPTLPEKYAIKADFYGQKHLEEKINDILDYCAYLTRRIDEIK